MGVHVHGPEVIKHLNIMTPPGISIIACERTINCHLLQPLLELHQKISKNMFLQSVFKSVEDSQKLHKSTR